MPHPVGMGFWVVVFKAGNLDLHVKCQVDTGYIVLFYFFPYFSFMISQTKYFFLQTGLLPRAVVYHLFSLSVFCPEGSLKCLPERPDSIPFHLNMDVLFQP